MRPSFRAVIRGRGTILLVLAALGMLAVPSYRLDAQLTGRHCTVPSHEARIVATSGNVSGGQPVGFRILGRATGSCAGRTFSIRLPPQLAPVRQTGSVIDPRGEQVGRVRSDRSGRVRIMFDAAPHQGAFAAAFAARLRFATPPDTRLRLRWRSRTTPIHSTTLHTAPCRHCRGHREQAVGRTWLDGAAVDLVLESIRSRQPGEHVRFSLHLVKTLAVRCGQVVAHLARNDLGRWGQLRPTGRLPLHALRCRRDHALFNRSGTVVTGWVRVPRARRYVVVSLRARVLDPEATRFQVWGRLGQRHEHSGIAIAARRYDALLHPAVSLVPEPAASPSASASPRPDPRPTHDSATAGESQDERGPVVATTLAILAAGLVVLMARMRRRSS